MHFQTTPFDDSYHILIWLPPLLLAQLITRAWLPVTMPKDGLSRFSTEACLVGGVLLCNVTKSLVQEGLSGPAWVQSTIATVQAGVVMYSVQQQ